MHRDRFPKGKAHFVGVDYLPPGESPTEEFPFTLVTGRILQHYNCGAQTRRTDILDVVDVDVLEMHPEDAARMQVAGGDLIRLVSPRATVLLPVMISERVQPGQLFTSFHFPASDVNSLLSSSSDDQSRCPEYKVSIVRVEPVDWEELDADDERELEAVRVRLIT